MDCGAIDPLPALAAIAREQGLWFHVDAAFGALGCLSPALRPLFAGIELADSVAFDFHKWGQVPYDAGCLLVRDGAAHVSAFGLQATYLRREGRGLAGGDPWPCDFGATRWRVRGECCVSLCVSRASCERFVCVCWLNVSFLRPGPQPWVPRP